MEREMEGEDGEIRSANEWMREAKDTLQPAKLFGDLWLENELAVMFADTGIGKSILAVQIAEAIARGTTPSAKRRHPSSNQEGSFDPGEVTAKPQRVLYLDFELTAKQFEMRYTSDEESKSPKHYKFSDRFKIYRPPVEELDRTDAHPFETVLRKQLETKIERSGAKVLIVDNITYLKRRADRSSEAAPMMKELKRLKSKYGLSILVIAHTHKRDLRRPITENDLQGAKVLSDFADNIFCIGQNRQRSNERYIKHIKMRSGEKFCVDGHVPVFTLGKTGGAFLGFTFRRFCPEMEMLREPTSTGLGKLIDEIKTLSDGGMTIRSIADELDMSKSAVHRYLQMWQPKGAEDDLEDEDDLPPPDPTLNPYYYPGREENDARRKELSEMGIFDDDIDSQFRSREYYILECASARARKIYLKTGAAPPLAEDEQYTAFMEAVRVYKESGGAIVQEPIAYIVRRFVIKPEEKSSSPSKGGDISETDGDRKQESGTTKSHETARTEIDETTEGTSHHPVGETPPPLLRQEGSFPENPLDRMKRVIDDYGKERFIESEYEDGKPRVWYQYRADGVLRRWENNGYSSTGGPPTFRGT